MDPQSIGKYTITRLLGRGGMGEVYQACDPLLDRQVAIKVIHPHLATEAGFLARFRREARFVASLRHPHIVQLHDFDVVDDQPFMVMEYLDGGTLKDRLGALRQQGQVMPLAETARILDAVASALDYAHTHGAVHRDVKPTNILFTAQGEPVLGDFGIAKILEESVQISAEGSILGTPAYLSPEQAGSAPVGPQSDLYSLGVVLYEMATGRVPFHGDSPTAVIMQHLNDPPPPPREFNPNLPPALQAVILRTLAKDPAGRYVTAADLARAFESALRGETPVKVGQEALTLVEDAQEAAAGPSSAEHLSPPAAWMGLRLPRPLLTTAILASLGILLGALYVSGLVARLPAWLAGIWPFLVVLLFASSAIASLGAAVRARTPAQRWQAAGVFALLAAAGLAWGGWFAFSQPAAPQGLVIAIGDFDGSQATLRVDFARRIYEQLQRELDDLADSVEVVRTFDTYPDAETARARGTERQATVVIWGWYDDVGVSPHIEALEIPQQRVESVRIPLVLETAGAAVATPRQPSLRDLSRYVRTPATMPDLELFVRNGPQQVATVAMAILGIAFHAQGDSAQALAFFDRALAGLPEGDDIVGQEVIYFQRAVALNAQNRVAEAVADLRQALAIKPDFYEAHRNLAIAYSELCTPTWQIERAISEAEAAVRLEPNDPAAHTLLGDLHRQAGAYDKAIAEYQASLQLEPGEPQTHERLGAAYTATGQSDAAGDAYRTAIGLWEDALDAPSADPLALRIALGDGRLAGGQVDQALADYEAASQLAPGDPSVHRGLGNAYYWKGQLDLAGREFRAWASVAPQDATPRLLLGLLALQQGNTAEAIAQLEEAAALDPCSASADLILGGLYWEQGDFVRAEAEYQAAVAIEPQNATALYLLGISQYLREEFQDAAQSLQAALAIREDFVEAHYALGKVYYDLKAYEEAAGQWTLATAYAPQDPAAYLALASAYEQLEQWDDAVAAYERAIGLQDEADTHVYLGLVYYRQGVYEKAIAEYQEALALDAENNLAHTGLAEAYAQLGRLEDAVAAYRQALAIEDSAAVRLELARVYARQGDTDAAIEELQKTIALDAEDWRLRLELGSLYEASGALDQAADQYRAAIAIEPGRPELHAALALVEFKRCNLGAASQAMVTAASLSPDTSLIRGALAAIYEAQGRSDDAASVYGELLAAPPSDISAHLLAGDYLLRSARLDDAEREFQSVLETPDLLPLLASLAHDGLGQTYYEQDKLLAAEGEFEGALSAFPANASAQAWLGDLALRKGDASGALLAYDRAAALLPGYAQQVSADQAALLAVGLGARRGLAFARLGENGAAQAAFDDAESLAQALIARTPQWAQGHFALALVHTARGDEAQAESEFALATQCDQSLIAARERVEANLARLR